MPNIQPFDAGNLALRPTEVGVEARAATARRVGTFYNQQAGAAEMLARETERLGAETARVGSETAALGSFKGQELTNVGRRVGSAISAAGDAAVSFMDNQQISHGAVGYSNLLMQKTQQFQDFMKNSDINDPTVGQKFMDSLEGDLTKFKEDGFYTENGQKWAEAHVNALRQHFAEKVIGEMSTRAGQAALVNNEQTVNSLSAAVHSDPSQSTLDLSLASYKSTLEGKIATSPNLTAEDAGNLRTVATQKANESIVKSAAIGYIEKNAALPPWINDPKYAPFVNGAELKQFEKAAQAQAKVNTYYDKQVTLAQKQLADQQVHAGATKVITDNVTTDPTTGKTIINPRFFKDALAIARNNPDAPSAAATARTMIDWGESQQNKERKVVTDPASASALDTRMFSSDNPTAKMEILRAEADGKLSRADSAIRTKIIDLRDKLPTDPQFKFAMDGAKQLIEGRTAGEKSLQSGKYASFMQEFFTEYQRQKAAGTLPPNALSLRDPNSLISKMMEAYKSPLAAAISGNGGVGSSASFNDRFGGASTTPTLAPFNVPAPATVPRYQIGDIVDTSEGPRRFKGGNFKDKKNWEPIS